MSQNKGYQQVGGISSEKNILKKKEVLKSSSRQPLYKEIFQEKVRNKWKFTTINYNKINTKLVVKIN